MDTWPGHAEIISYRIIGAYDAESRQSLPRGLEIGGMPGQKAKTPTGRRHVGVERYDQPPLIGTVPGARIDAIMANHPAQIQKDPLGSRATGWIREKVAAPWIRLARLAGQ